MFWSNFWGMHQFNQNSHLNELLKSNDSTVEELLSEENFLNDVKQIHEKFADYLVKNPQKLKKIIDYCLLNKNIQENGAENGNNVISNKFPFIASEIFQGQPPNLDKYLFGQYTHLEEQENNEEENDKKSQEDQVNSSSDNNPDDKILEVEDEVSYGNNGPEQQQQQQEQQDEQEQETDQQQNSEQEQQEQQVQEQEKEKEKEQENELESKQQNQEQEQEQENQPEEQEKEDEEEILQQEQQQQQEGEKEQLSKEQIQELVEKKKEEQQQMGKEILLYIFEFLDREKDEDHYTTCAGYFSKIVGFLTSTNGNLFQFFKQNTVILKKFLNHMHNRCMAKLVIGFIILEGTEVKAPSSHNSSYNEHKFYDDNQEENDKKDSEKDDDQVVEKNSDTDKDEDQFLELRQMLLNELFQQLKNSEDSEVVENICYVLQEVLVYIVKNNSFFPQITELFYYSDNLEILFFLVNQFRNESWQLQPVVGLLRSIFQQLSVIQNSNSYNEHLYEDDQVLYNKESELLNDRFPFEIYMQQIPKLIDIIAIQNVNNDNIILNQYQQPLPSFGLGKLEILDLLLQMVKCKSEIMLEGFEKSNIYVELFQLFKCYEWNSMIQNSVFQIFAETINQSSENLVRQFFQQTNILSFIINNYDQKCKPGQYQNEINRGFLGYLIQLSSLFQEKQQEKEEIKQALKSCEGWENFVLDSLFHILRLQKDYQWGEKYDQEFKIQVEDAPNNNNIQFSPFNQEENDSQQQNGNRNFVQKISNDFVSKRKNLFDSSSDEDDDDDDDEEQNQKEKKNSNEFDSLNQNSSSEEETGGNKKEEHKSQQNNIFHEQDQQLTNGQDSKKAENGVNNDYSTTSFWSIGVNKDINLDDEDIEW